MELWGASTQVSRDKRITDKRGGFCAKSGRDTRVADEWLGWDGGFLSDSSEWPSDSGFINQWSGVRTTVSGRRI